MQETWTREGPHEVMCLCLLVVPCHGWRSCLQNCTSLFSTEAQYIAPAKACKEAIWLAHLVKELGMIVEMPTLHCDSQNAIMLAKNLGFHAKTKAY